MQVRLVDPATMTVVRTYGSMTDAFADRAQFEMFDLPEMEGRVPALEQNHLRHFDA